MYHALIKKFNEITNCPMVVNTSFNVRGEPIVCTPLDAFRLFMATNMDVMQIENVVLRKEKQTAASVQDAQSHLSQFAAD
jgi:carbamoyltransferase